MCLLELLPVAKFHAQIWQFLKWACISETLARRAKIKFDSHGIETEYNYTTFASGQILYPNMAILKIDSYVNEPRFYICTCTFDLLVFKGFWGHLVHLSQIVRREKRSEIWKSGVSVNMYMGYL